MIRQLLGNIWRRTKQLGLYVLLGFAIMVSLLFSLALWQSPQRSLDSKTTNSQQEVVSMHSYAEVYDFSGLVVNESSSAKAIIDFRPSTDNLVSKVSAYKVKASKQKTLSASDYLAALSADQTVVMQFPDQVAGKVVQRILGDQYDLPSKATINYIQLDAQSQTVTFYSDANHHYYRYPVQNKQLQLPNLLSKKHVVAVKWSEADQQVKLLYEEAINLQRYRYLVTNTDLQSFANVLFTGSKQVNTTQDDNNNLVYADGENKRLTINQTSKIGVFDVFNSKKKLPNVSGVMEDGYDMLGNIQQTSDSINYFASENNGDTLIYRLNVNGLPIFNLDKLGLVKFQMISAGHQQVDFSGTTLQVPLPVNDDDTVTLPSTADAETWASQVGINPDKIEDLRIGYYWQTDTGDTVTLQPEWFYKYDGEWQSLGTNPATRTGGS